MSDFFKGFTTQGMEEQGDRLGGFQLLDSDIYPMTIKAAWHGKSSGGAISVSFLFDHRGQEYRETFYVSNKKGEPFYLTANNKKAPLPGFTIVNDICVIATEKELEHQATEEKVVKVWDPDEKKELPKSVPMLADLVGKQVALGVIKRLVNKAEQDSSGKWVDTAESKEENLTDKVFHPELKVTVTEAKQGQQEPKFWDAWLKRNKGQVPDRRTIKDGQAPSGGGSAPKAGGSAPPAAPKQSLFGKKS